MANLLNLFHFVPFRSVSHRRLGLGFHPHPSLLPSREKGSDRLHGNDGGGLLPGPIWPCLASFTPTVEAGNGATLASFGTPFTRTHCASMRPRWPRLVSSGVARSGETFKTVSFSRISSHFSRRRGLGLGMHLRLDLTVFTGTTEGVGGATAGTESLDRDRLRWCTLATPGIGPGRSRPRHACRNLGDGGLWRV